MPPRNDGALWLPGVVWEGGASPAPEPPDASERARALDTSRSFIVQAPAGSGKTELLIQRYLALLGAAEEPEAIVAITFTIKAAAEMRARVLEAIERAAGGSEAAAPHERVTLRLASEALARDRRLGWGLLSNPGRMRIQTIDALCLAIARQMPWTARLGAMPDMIEDATELHQEAAGRTLSLLESSDVTIADAVETLLLHVENDSRAVEELIARMLAQRDQWLRLVGADADMTLVRRSLEMALRRATEEGLRAARDAMPAGIEDRIAALARHAAANLGARHDFPPQCLEAWQWLADLLLTTSDGWRKKPNATVGFPPKTPEKEQMTALLEEIAENEELRSALADVRTLPGPAFDDGQWRVMEAVVRVLRRAAVELNVVFADRGRVDFNELAIRARQALGSPESPTDLGLALGSRLEHLLVDEFQDTSELQFDLLECLTAGWDAGDGRTLFLVGDPAQSIYRFRQAEVGLFLKVRREGVQALRPERLSLIANFRSDPALVEWVNRAFVRIFPPREDIDSGAVPYSESAPFRERSGGEAVVVHPVFEEDAEPVIAVRIIEASRREEPDGRIAVLVRARSHLAGIAAQLRQSGIPFRAVEIETLEERPVVQDLLALTRALLHLGDRLSWLAILRAPWCGLTLADLHAIAAPDWKRTVWDLLRRPDLTISEDGRERLNRIVPILESSLADAGRIPLRPLVERAWVSLGGPRCLEFDADLDDALAYLDLLGECESGGDLPSFEAFNARVAKLFAQPDPEAGEAVQLMTIHKAKGLEFDTVVIPGLGRHTRQDEQNLLAWVEREGPDGRELLMSPSPPRRGSDPVYAYVAKQDREKAKNEASRLLYVACTRARRRLHLIGHVAVGDDGELRMPESGSLLSYLWPAVEDEFRTAWERSAPAPVAKESAAAPHPIRRLPTAWTAPAWPEPVRWTAGSAPAASASETQPFRGVEESYRRAGTVVHRMLERIANEGVEHWTAGRVQSTRAAMRRALAEAGVPPGDLESALERTLSALANTVADPCGRWLLSAHDGARSEYEIAGVLDGTVYRAAIDRTFVDADGTRWIVDFKTSAEAILDAEQARYATQMQRYARLFTLIETRPIRLGLYFPVFGGWREWAPAENQSFSTRLDTSTARTP